jgi:hypothetical protein
MKGFGLLVALLFVLILTLFSFTVLTLAGSYYASTRSFFEIQNARLNADQAASTLVDRHNLAGQHPVAGKCARVVCSERLRHPRISFRKVESIQ